MALIVGAQSIRGALAARNYRRVRPGSLSGWLDWFAAAHKVGGASYQPLINEALVEHMAATREPLEGMLRRVIREELRKRAEATD